MKWSAAVMFAAAVSLPLWAEGGGAFDGTWVGELKAGVLVLHVVFTISSSAGSLSATMDSPDQGASGIPVSRAHADGRRIVLEVKSVTGSYSGELSADGASIDGTWSQSGQSFPVLLRKNDGPFVLNRPQEPTPPFPYTSTDVSFTDQKAGVELAGTLTVPPGRGPFPAVILVTGSGPQNRDEELMGHKPFLVIADYLSRNGVAVLRYDDRGVGRSRGSFTAATTLDFADDAQAAFAFLCARPEVDPARAGICGHSEGAIITLLVAARDSAVRFIIMLAGPGLKGEDLLLLQNAALARASGMDEKQIAAANATNRRIYDVVIRESDPQRVKAEVRKILPESKATDPALASIASPWFRTFLTLDPTVPLATLRIPVLAMIGSKDLQVPADPNLAAIEAALKKAGTTSCRVRKLEGLNHLFQHASTGLPSEYGSITETFAPEALSAIRDLILGTR